MVQAERIDITIEDIIAHNGPRGAVLRERAQGNTTAFVAVVLPGQTPSPDLLERTDAIRRQWITYWEKVTGGVATMSTGLDVNAPSDTR